MSKRKSTTRGQRTMAQVIQTAGRQARAQQLAADNQKASITRLLGAMQGGDPEDGAHAAEITVLNITLGHTQQRLEEALERVKALEHALANQLPGATVPGVGEEFDMGRRKDAFMAGFEAGETVDDADQAWKDFKKAEAEEAEDTDGDDE